MEFLGYDRLEISSIDPNWLVFKVDFDELCPSSQLQFCACPAIGYQILQTSCFLDGLKFWTFGPLCFCAGAGGGGGGALANSLVWPLAAHSLTVSQSHTHRLHTVEPRLQNLANSHLRHPLCHVHQLQLLGLRRTKHAQNLPHMHPPRPCQQCTSHKQSCGTGFLFSKYSQNANKKTTKIQPNPSFL
ncbi:unnamed protein product [Ambrosiozyma monospora]|uniref:Unnamed protein product n=1 Tax=Ambrosiozyma monospora TaxID=43982 RepID=A0A9W7DII2_AMBMO|nr:unnamed protein product [Ambrosiozyma monospora]